jgi:hypothetical protein
MLDVSCPGVCAVLAPLPSLPSAPSEAAHQVEMPWWGYGPQGMQLWFPSTLAAQAPAGHTGQHQQQPQQQPTQGHLVARTSGGGGAAQPQQSAQQWQPVPPPQDIELEFDQEVNLLLDTLLLDTMSAMLCSGMPRCMWDAMMMAMVACLVQFCRCTLLASPWLMHPL